MKRNVLTRTPGDRLFGTTSYALVFGLVITLLSTVLPSRAIRAQNSIVTENSLPGNPASEWDITGAGDLSIQGFATDISVNKGSTVHFKINVTDGAQFGIKIYRLGYYAGNGARLIDDLGTFTGTIQPDPITDLPNGLVDCGNWSESATWNVPANAVSGVYIARLTKTVGGGASHIIFIVRDDAATSDILFKTSDATWQAYNVYGGNSLYVGTTDYPQGHATKVSYNRPYIVRNGGGGGSAGEDFVFNAEYPMIRFLERNGYDVSYTTDVDMARSATPITPANHKALLSVGHDEYWSAEERAKFENARAAGVHLAFFSGNEVYWKTRWDKSIDGNNTDFRTMICYKEGTQGENVCGSKCDPEPNIWTGLWRAGCTAGLDACSPENALTGQISWGQAANAITVPAKYKDFRFWRNTDITSLGTGQTTTLTDNTIGFEFDWTQNQYKSSYPLGRVPLSSTDVNGKLHEMSLYRSSSGALVFGAGTVQYTWGLDDNHDNGNFAPDARMQQATLNLFADMGALPTTLMAGMVMPTPSNDNQAPSSTITAPAQNDNITTSTYIHITGTATEAGGGVVAGVQISVDNGATWQEATGTTNWSYDWLPTASGTYTILARASDDLGNLEAAGTAPAANAITVNVNFGAPTCPCSIFPQSTPTNLLLNDNTPIEVGNKFKSSVNGYITAIKFYKPGNAGVYTVNLWDNETQQRITYATVTETGTGWMTVDLPAPVAITAGHVYLATYYSSAGDYASTDNFFTTAYINGYLEAIQDTPGNENGVYHLGLASSPENNYQTFPTSFYQATNYWVDVVFNTTVPPDVTAPTVSHVSPIPNGESVLLNASLVAIFSEPIDPATITNQSFILKDASNNLVSGTVSYNADTRTATFTPAANFNYASTYTATIKGGATYNSIKDLAGNNMVADTSWSFTTRDVPPPPPTVGPGGPILVIHSASNPFSIYPVEILRAEGLNEFAVRDIADVNADTLNRYDVVLLGNIPISAGNLSDLTAWVNAGGTLIAFKPDAQLASLLGLTPAVGSLSNTYIKVNTSAGTPGAGIVGETIQFHGAADLYTLNGATKLAALYSNATDSTVYPAVTSMSVGSNGGKAIAFTYDLAKSIVYTRQGNPAWAGQKRDGEPTPIRSDDMFYGNASFDPQPDWIDFNKILIPQADEQQHLLANIITQASLHRKAMPRFWFLPRKLKAAVVMTGDDHANAGTVGRFDMFLGYGNNTAQDVLDWKAIRGTSYLYPNTPITDAQAAAYNAEGFELALHLNTNCSPYDQTTLQEFFANQLPLFTANFPSLPNPVTHRTHCVAWSDWASKPKVEIANGIRLNTDYYYWPASWVNNRVGLFTGSAMPMRFADIDGSILDNYQVTTQMPDESDLNVSGFISTLLDNALSSKGYYGVFCANMHTDYATPTDRSTIGSKAIVDACIARGIPVISAKQMLTWLDGRNNSSFNNISWAGNKLSFDISMANGAHGLQAMVPIDVSDGALTSITVNGSPVSYTTEEIKGINYAFFDAVTGTVEATYAIDDTPPVISNIKTTPNIDGTLTVSWTTDEPATSVIDYGTSEATLNQNSNNASLVTAHSITLSGLSVATTYYLRLSSADMFNNTATSPAAPAQPLIVTMPNSLCFNDQDSASFAAGTTGDSTYVSLMQDGELMLKPALSAEFGELPPASEWNSFPWTGGTSTVSGGVLTVQGARFNAEAASGTVSAGSSLEFVATFNAEAGQHIGFGAGTDATGFNGIYNGEQPWAMFSTQSTTNTLFARTFDGTTAADFSISGNYIGSSHKYRIDWKANSVDFYIDDSLVHTQNVTINVTMRPAISDYYSTEPGINVNWIRVSPYQSAGTFLSRVYDPGEVRNWETVMWTADVPDGTSMQVSVRRGDTAVPDDSWTAFTVIPSSGTAINANARYIQYKVDFTTNNSNITPVLKAIGISCNTATNDVPEVTRDPQAQTVCEGDTAIFVTRAIGNPVPTVQWQISLDNGINWADSTGAISDTLKFVTVAADSARQYRAVWTNSAGHDTSAVALLTVHAKPVAIISAVDTAVCAGSPVVLQLDSASGPGPYTLTVNGRTYSNVATGDHFASIYPFEQSVWGNGGNPANANQNDGVATELGVKFRSSVAGYIRGVRFFKGSANTGAHTGSLWNSSGTQLATGSFASESDSGWQELRFTTPVLINANTTYIASYSSPNGVYAYSPGYFAATDTTSGSLTVLQSGVDGANGVKLAGTGFPNTGTDANYWVDVLFDSLQTTTQTAQFKVTRVTNGNGCTNLADSISGTRVTVNATPGGSIAAATATTCNQSGINLIFTATQGTGPFTLVINDSTYNNVESGQAFDTRVLAQAQTDTQSIWSSSTVGDAPASPDGSSIELGVKFRTIVDGQITGIRFYKLPGNTGQHTGSLWKSDGTLLATADFGPETSSGWQQVNFSTPVNVTAGTTYIASYYAPNGNYAYTANAFTNSGVTNASGTITALQAGVDGGNGVFNPNVGGGFPASSGSNANYWVDVAFKPAYSVAQFNLSSITSATGCSTTGNPLSTATVRITQVEASVIVTNATCPGSATGSITVNGMNGTAPYSYSIDTGANYQSSGLFANLAAGSYLIKVKDATDCSKDTVITVSQPAVISTSISLTNNSCHGETSGSFTANATGGTAPYTYSIDTGSTYQSSGEYTGLKAGDYLLRIKDANSCTWDTVITITQPEKLAGTLSVVNSCPGNPVTLVYNASTGTGPFNLVINGVTYNNVTNGGTINTGITPTGGAESIWDPSAVGGTGPPDNQAIEVGVKFRANVAGQITGIRFYKLSTNAATHTGSLWTSDGTLLATATFTNETTSGWQQVDFATPVTVTPGVTYVASYYTPIGSYAVTTGAFTNDGVTNAEGTLTALKAGVDGGNGLYKYGQGGGFPTDVSPSNANYWVDVVFNNTSGQGRYLLTSINSASGCTNTSDSISAVYVGIVPVAGSFAAQSLSCPNTSDGSITISGTGGVAPYTYSIDNGANFQNDGSFTGLAAGTYQTVVKDANGCTKDSAIVIDVETATWTGATSNDWHTASNWSNNKVPGASTHVIIPAGTANPCVISTADADAASVQAKTGATVNVINNHILTIHGKCSVLPGL